MSKSDTRLKVGILFGGMSAEHEVSIASAKAVCKNIDREKFSPLLIYINKKGRWCQIETEDLLEAEPVTQFESFSKRVRDAYRFYHFSPWENVKADSVNCDIFFPVLHGPNGEDGKIQGLLELARKPYVGANSFSSALAMNKVVSKILFKQAGLKTPDFIFFEHEKIESIKKTVLKKFSLPVFIKPSSLGSSVGISKVKEESQLDDALRMAFDFDKQIIIEKAIQGRELEISVMGNRDILVSLPGELSPAHEFYDYADKYIDNRTSFNIPANLEPGQIQEIREMATCAYRTLFLNGMSRIDFFLENRSGDIYLNEINTIPGFTEISMFPKLWTLQGISFTDLITKLIEYGIEYFKIQSNG
jgi:D-alanine-D-alanine ligase